jgi:hypothetical protein
MNLVMKSSRGKAARPSEHILAANASNTAKIHKKQVTLQLEKRARYCITATSGHQLGQLVQRNGERDVPALGTEQA